MDKLCEHLDINKLLNINVPDGELTSAEIKKASPVRFHSPQKKDHKLNKLVNEPLRKLDSMKSLDLYQALLKV